MSRDKETETKLVSEFNERYKQGVKDWHTEEYVEHRSFRYNFFVRGHSDKKIKDKWKNNLRN